MREIEEDLSKHRSVDFDLEDDTEDIIAEAFMEGWEEAG